MPSSVVPDALKYPPRVNLRILSTFTPYQLRAHARNLRERYRVLVAVDPWGPGTFLQGCWCLNCFCLLRSVRAQLMVIWDERLCRTYPHYYADRHGNN